MTTSSHTLTAAERSLIDLIRTLKSARIARQLSCDDLARLANLPVETVTQFEAFEADPTLETAFVLAGALDARIFAVPSGDINVAPTLDTEDKPEELI